MIRRYADGSIRFEGKNAEAERLAVRAPTAERHDRTERLHAEHMALLGKRDDPTRTVRTREVQHLVGDEQEEELWEAWHARGR